MEKTPKDEAEAVMNVLLPIAQQALSRYGGFMPFAAVMRADGTIVPMRVEGASAQPQQETIEQLAAAFRAGAEAGTHRATGLALQIRTTVPGATEQTDAVAVQLEHAGGYAVVVVYPFRRSARGEVAFDAPFARQIAGAIF